MGRLDQRGFNFSKVAAKGWWSKERPGSSHHGALKVLAESHWFIVGTGLNRRNYAALSTIASMVESALPSSRLFA
jgi:hypothetical protein